MLSFEFPQRRVIVDEIMFGEIEKEVLVVFVFDSTTPWLAHQWECARYVAYIVISIGKHRI